MTENQKWNKKIRSVTFVKLSSRGEKDSTAKARTQA
ncbi:predicted protein [Plenodomus lingam JN3]|uniref:Uncharacterized protein n=1 Tax=Leptosphaeria maculans (strain JN3 / isolate v23.1.3 / race Av1-4-5-6-7-8) TaxID=985895 RepID=E5A7H4_LEPMJ|nr:predicted protein [Plenodomus lingam JN3]CBX99569.1 predicted protein [Plenodomus lingam JN3]